jgi:alpha-D-ribose 1-methylphosphonate 5-triphosphate synthase subunit PhnL
MVDITRGSPREIVQLRASVVGYVSQFLRVIPRISAIDVVAEPLLERGTDGHPLMEPGRCPR